VTRLTASRYRDLCVLVNDALDHRSPLIQEVGSECQWPIAIYLLGHRDPVTNAFVVDYVGSAFRRTSDASSRVREHLHDPRKYKRFSCQVVLPLRKETELREVRRLEGVVARALGTPRWCQRIPGGRF
jgi:hypothetical protein